MPHYFSWVHHIPSPCSSTPTCTAILLHLAGRLCFYSASQKTKLSNLTKNLQTYGGFRERHSEHPSISHFWMLTALLLHPPVSQPLLLMSLALRKWMLLLPKDQLFAFPPMTTTLSLHFLAPKVGAESVCWSLELNQSSWSTWKFGKISIWHCPEDRNLKLDVASATSIHQRYV